VAYNAYIIIPFATWAVAQISKFAIAAFHGRVDFRNLYASGGMPSVHSAVVCSLATTALLVDGADSHLFGFTAIFAAIVMYDSFGVRRSSGEQAVAINMLIESLKRDRVKLDQPQLRLREILGHQPKEVTAGAVLGIALAALFNYDKLGGLTAFLQTVPQMPELIGYAVVFALILLGGVATKLILKARYPKSKTMKQLGSRILGATQTTGWLGLFTVVLAYEHASYFAWRLWPILVLLVAVIWGVWLAAVSYKVVPEAMAKEANEARKLKWLNWGKGRKKRA
jgi:acid phosphatase family membrane protein YuiD